MLTEEERSNELVKSFLDGGFDENVVEAWIREGRLKIEKSEETEDPKEGDEDPQGEEPKNSGKGNDEGETEDPKEDEKKGCGKEGSDINKSLSDFKEDIIKSFNGEVKGVSDELFKSIENVLDEKINGLFERLEKSLGEMISKSVGSQVPSFKGAGLSRAVIEKSVVERDEDNKVVLSISRDRNAVRTLLSKSIDEEKDENIRKSLIEGTRSYMVDGLFGEISRDAAQYMYDNKGVRLVK